MQEAVSYIVTADMLEELDKLWSRKGLDTLQLVFFCSYVNLSSRMELAEAV